MGRLFIDVKEGKKGKLFIDGTSITFAKNKENTYFELHPSIITELFYSRVSGRRIGAAVLVTPLLLFSKGKKHYLTLSFNDGAGLIGAIEFKLHKSNYRPILRTLEEVTGLTMHYDHEGIKDSEEVPAQRDDS